MTVEDQESVDQQDSYVLPSVQLPLKRSYTYASPVPQALVESKEPCILGVDEAGRGPCLGPMVYAVCYYPASRHKEFKELGFDDSKKLTEDRRVALAQVIEANLDWVGWAVHVIAPQEISSNMFCRPPFNLNEIAHSATMDLIRNVLNSNIVLSEIYVDPVGPSQSYKAKLTRYFPGIEFTIEPHADALYPSVSAASVCAKVTRDQILQNWVWLEPGLEGKVSKAFGSGYPSDPKTVQWLDDNEDQFFGFPSLIRFSWKTISSRMEATRNIEWSEDEDEAEPQSTSKKRTKTTQQQESGRHKNATVHQHHRQGRFYKSFALEPVNSFL